MTIVDYAILIIPWRCDKFCIGQDMQNLLLHQLVRRKIFSKNFRVQVCLACDDRSKKLEWKKEWVVVRMYFP